MNNFIQSKRITCNGIFYDVVIIMQIINRFSWSYRMYLTYMILNAALITEVQFIVLSSLVILYIYDHTVTVLR